MRGGNAHGGEVISKKSEEDGKRKISTGVIVGLITVAGSIAAIYVAFFPTGPQISQYFYDRSAHVSIVPETLSFYSCVVEGVDERCVEIPSSDPDYMPRIRFDIANNSSKPIAFHNEDAVTVSLEDYIPYEDLVISNEAGGAEGWDTPVNFSAYLGTEEGDYRASSDEHADTTKSDYYSTLTVDAGDSRRFLLTVYPSEAGLYKFKVKLKYYYGGKEQSYETDEGFYYVYTAGTY